MELVRIFCSFPLDLVTEQSADFLLVVSLRRINRIQVWTRATEPAERLQRIGTRLVELLEITPGKGGVELEFRVNHFTTRTRPAVPCFDFLFHWVLGPFRFSVLEIQPFPPTWVPIDISY